MMKRQTGTPDAQGGPSDPIHSIWNEDDHAAALQAIDQLWDRTDDASKPRLEELAELVDEYERRHHVIEAPVVV